MSNPNPFGLSQHLLKLGSDQDLNSDQVQHLFSLPFLSDLFRAEKETGLRNVDHDLFLQALGYGNLHNPFEITTGSLEFTESLVAHMRRKGIAAHEGIREDIFPIYPHKHAKRWIYLLDPGESFDEDDVMRLYGLHDPILFQPTYQEVLYFVATYADKMPVRPGKHHIVFPHAPIADSEKRLRRISLRLHSPAHETMLDLGYADSGYKWNDNCLLAGVVFENA